MATAKYQQDNARHSETSHSHGGHHHGGDVHDGRLAWALGLTTGFMVIEVLAGLWSGSLALIADAGHMLTDSASLALALFAAITSRRVADELRTFGYGRARVLAAFVNGMLLLLISAWIVIEAAQRLRDPVPILAGPMLAVAIAGLLVNVIGYLILRGGADINTRGALAHVLSDLLGSVAAITAAGVILLTGWTPADPLLSVIVAALIVRTGWRVVRESGHALLEGSPPGFDAERLRESLLQTLPDVLDVHHIHAWTVDADEAYLTLHVQVAESLAPDAAIAAVQRHLAEHFQFRHTTVQVEHRHCPAPDH